MSPVTVTLYGQVNDGALYPLGWAEGDTTDECNRGLADILRMLVNQHDPEAAIRDIAERYEQGIDDQ